MCLMGIVKVNDALPEKEVPGHLPMKRLAPVLAAGGGMLCACRFSAPAQCQSQNNGSRTLPVDPQAKLKLVQVVFRCAKHLQGLYLTSSLAAGSRLDA